MSDPFEDADFVAFKLQFPQFFPPDYPIDKQYNVYKAGPGRVKTEQELQKQEQDRLAQQNSLNRILAVSSLRPDESIQEVKVVEEEEEAKAIAFAKKFNKEIEDAAIKEGSIKAPEVRPDFVIDLLNAKGEPNGKKAFDHVLLSDHIAETFTVYNFMGSLYVYNKNTGMFKRDTNIIQTELRDISRKWGITERLTTVEREALTHLKSMGCVETYPFVGPYGCIHVKNGCLDLQTGEIKPTSPDDMFDYRIETEYKRFDATPELDTFFETYGITESIDILAKAIWQRGVHDTLKEITVLFGPKDSGKTTLAELVQATIDGKLELKISVSRSLLHELLQRFGYANLEGKLMNYGDDLPDMFVRNASFINAMVGSVIQHIEKKGVDGYDATITAYHVFSANNLPPLDDDDSVIWAKIRLVECKKIVAPEKRVPKEKLFTQILKEQLLYRAVEKAKEWMVKPYVKTQDADTIRAIWHAASTDVDLFMLEAVTDVYYDLDETNQPKLTSLDAIKKHYDEWCKDNARPRHVKYLQKRLQPFWRKSRTNNAYALKCISWKKENKQTGLTN